MKIGIIGSRGFDEPTLIEDCLERVIRPYEDDCRYLCFFGGGSKGAERLAAEYIEKALGFDYILFKPYNFIDTKVPHHPKYFSFRNKQIVDNADLVLVFDDGEERSLMKTVEYLVNVTHKSSYLFHKDGTSSFRLNKETTCEPPTNA